MFKVSVENGCVSVVHEFKTWNEMEDWILSEWNNECDYWVDNGRGSSMEYRDLVSFMSGRF